ncbi:hypothetical protein ACSDR0_42605 [Streptosporangium sp. G11]|uniref:hypothetical protein n=1 Tax=Streptosporangium sp. G11 TaxID=3436926 RepID=UPI003EB77AB3
MLHLKMSNVAFGNIEQENRLTGDGVRPLWPMPEFAARGEHRFPPGVELISGAPGKAGD